MPKAPGRLLASRASMASAEAGRFQMGMIASFQVVCRICLTFQRKSPNLISYLIFEITALLAQNSSDKTARLHAFLLFITISNILSLIIEVCSRFH
jgi:hypothetical protein